MRRATDNVVRLVAIPFEQEVGFADGVGFGVNFLAVEVSGDSFAVLLGDLPQRFLGDGEHSAGATRAVIEQVRTGLDAVSHWQEQSDWPLGERRREVSSVLQPLRCSLR